MERTWESLPSHNHPSCPPCPCDLNLQSTAQNSNSSVQTCTCFCDRTHQQKANSEVTSATKTEEDIIPASAMIELFEYVDKEENDPQVDL